MNENDKSLKEKNASLHHSQDASTPSLSVGLVAAPEIPTELADKIAPELSDLLADYVDDRFSWEVHVVTDPFTGAADLASSVMDDLEKVKQRHGWNYAIGLSDLPFFVEQQLLVAETNPELGTAQISLPGLGAVPMVRRLREAIPQLISELYYGSSEVGRERQEEQNDRMGNYKGGSLRNIGTRKLMGKGLGERMAPIHRVPPAESRVQSGVRFVIRSRVSGYLRVMSGMVWANHPLRIFSAFQSVLATAFTTGAFALIFPTLWKLADAYSVGRSAILMITALVGLTSWIIVSHGLWEKKSSKKEYTVAMRRLYNLTTVITLSTGVILYYCVLFLCFFLALFLFIPISLLESNTGVGHPVGPWYFFSLAWIVSSLATWLGALGAGLADEEKVWRATYGYRQLQLKQRAKREEEENNNQ